MRECGPRDEDGRHKHHQHTASLLRAVKTAVSMSATSREAAEAVRHALIVVPERSGDVEAWAERALASTASASSSSSSFLSRQSLSSAEDTLALTAALDLVRRVARIGVTSTTATREVRHKQHSARVFLSLRSTPVPDVCWCERARSHGRARTHSHTTHSSHITSNTSDSRVTALTRLLFRRLLSL